MAALAAKKTRQLPGEPWRTGCLDIKEDRRNIPAPHGRYADDRQTKSLLIDYKIGLNKDLKIIAYEATFYQNGGAAADLVAGSYGKNFISLHQFLFYSECKSNCLQLQNKFTPQYSLPWFWRPTGNVCDRSCH